MNSDISKLIKNIQDSCKQIDSLKEKNKEEYRVEAESVDEQIQKMSRKMQNSLDSYLEKQFSGIENDVNALIARLLGSSLSVQKADALRRNAINGLQDFSNLQQCTECFTNLLEKLNSDIQKLNGIDFDAVDPPLKFEGPASEGESFTVKRGEKEYPYKLSYDGQLTPSELPTSESFSAESQIVEQTLIDGYAVTFCIEKARKMYQKGFDFSRFESDLAHQKTVWMSEVKARLDRNYDTTFDKLFRDSTSFSRDFFEDLIRMGQESDVDLDAGAAAYNERMTIGNYLADVSDEPTHLAYFKESPVLNRYLNNGKIEVPMVFDIKECGNILLEINEDAYSQSTIDFVNQLVIQFLLSFPANRTNFCLIDPDDKMEFSPFNALKKINPDVFFGGEIIRDDRKVEGILKDLEQRMYKVNDDILSFNGVQDIFEYNSKFESTPQNVCLLVLVNYPSAMQEDALRKLQKLVQGGRKTGIFTLVVSNSAYHTAREDLENGRAATLAVLEKNALVIQKNNDQFFFVGEDSKYILSPKTDITIAQLPRIIEMLKENAEQGRKVVISMDTMFKYSDGQRAKGESYASVLDIPIGLRGGEIQSLRFSTNGDGSAHAVVIGGTGSGKSNLLHTIILNACYRYSPEELSIYLVDFKGGVEFKYYEANKVVANQLPHIRLTGLTSDLGDGLAILSNLKNELRRREAEFRRLGVEDIVQYHNAGNTMPRILVIIDEMQELFLQDDRLGQKAIDILRDFFQKGRAFGISVLLASQSIPHVAGLKNNILNQIRNRICLRLNEPDDAIDIHIDPKAVRNLNRPEKGLGIINEGGNDSNEFRVAYAENSTNRIAYTTAIIKKWKKVVDPAARTPLFIVGDDGIASPTDGRTIFAKKRADVVVQGKTSESMPYLLQIGQEYITGEPMSIKVQMRQSKQDILFAGYDIEILRDMMGYALLSVMLNHLTDSDFLAKPGKLYCINGELINSQNSQDLFHVIQKDFSNIVETGAVRADFIRMVKELYLEYRSRRDAETVGVRTPCFLFIHSLQRFSDLFADNPRIHLTDAPETRSEGLSVSDDFTSSDDLFAAGRGVLSGMSFGGKTSASDEDVFFVEAFKTLLSRGSDYGIHLVLSLDNPTGIQEIRQEIKEVAHKVFTRGVKREDAAMLLQSLDGFDSIANPQIGLYASPDDQQKVKLYRYNGEEDNTWYSALVKDYTGEGSTDE